MMDDILTGMQQIANGFMIDTVTITLRAAPAKDPSNPFGDEDILYESTSVTVPAWIVSPFTKSLDDQGGMSVVVDLATLRVPVGTVITRGAKVVHRGDEFFVVGDPSSDETWPAMVKVAISREE